MPSFQSAEITCVADAHKPKLVRVSVKTNPSPGPGQVLWAKVSSGGVTHQGAMKKQGRRYILTPVNLPEDPVSVYVKLILDGEPQPVLAEVEQTFDLARQIA